MKKGFLITSLSLAAIALVSCATSNINPVATDSSTTTNTPINDNGSNAITKVQVEISMNREGKYNGGDFCTFEVRPGTLWRAAKENFDFTKVTYDQYRSFKMFSFKPYMDDEIPDSYVVEDDVTLYVRYDVTIPPEKLCTVNWYTTDPKQEAREPLMAQETYGVGEKPEYRGPDPTIFNPTIGHEYRFIGWDPEPTTLSVAGDYSYVAKFFDVTEEHTVTFDYQYDGILNRVMVKHGDTVEPIEPVRTGWTFGGWYETPECSGDPFNFNTPITANKTLYAKWTQDECVVTFYSEYPSGSVYKTITVNYGEKVVPPENPIKEHYDFYMWVDINGAQFDFNTSIIVATDLYATYTPSLYTVTFDMNGAPSFVDPKVAPYNTKIDLPSPSWAGHDFTGWKEGGQSVGSPYTVKGDVTLKASWSQNTCDVYFWEGNGAVLPTIKTVKYGECVASYTPAYEGHTFKCWTADPAILLESPPFDFSTPIKDDLNLWAIWETVYLTVTFNCNGGQFSDGSITTTRSVQYSRTISSLDAPEEPTREGYNFKGWYDDDGNEFEFSVIGILGGTDVYTDMNIHASWNKKGNNTVYFYVDGGLYTQRSVEYGQKVSKPEDPSKPGYDFKDWYEDGSPFNFDTPIKSEHTLYAVWSDPESCTVTFIANGGTPAPGPQTVSYGSTIDQPGAMTRDGYDFGGWYKDPNFSGEPYDFASSVTSSFNLYAKWNPKDALTVRFFITAGQQYGSDVLVPWGQKVTKPADPTNPGHDFLGWLYNGSEFSFDTPITQSIDLYANWSDVEQCTVTFISNGGSPVAAQTVDYGATMQAPTDPTRDGYDFEGWYTDQGLIPESKFTFPATITSSFNLYAKWTPKGAVTVTFYTAVGEQYLDPVTVEYGGRVNRPADPTNPGHDFLGWYDNAACTGSPFDFNTSITNNLNLYAKWSGIEMCQVTFISNGGTIIEPAAVEYGSAVVKPDPDPVKDGYTFKGWFTDQELTNEYDFATLVTASFNLYAKWELNPIADVAVHFVDYDGSVQEETVPYGQRVIPVTPKDKPGYTFLGWYKGDVQFDFKTPITEETTLNAKWSDERIQYVVTFISNGGSDVAPIPVYHGDTISAPTEPTRYGYVFAGWYKDQALTDAYVFSTPVTSSFNLYAKWNKKEDCTVTFMDGSETFATVTVAYGDKVTPVDPTKSGFTFDGWYKDQQLTELFDFEHTHIESATYIYGKWTEIPPTPTDQITVTFNPNGGTYVPSVDIEPGSTIMEEPECTREGYKLDGWYYTPSGGVETKFEFGVTTLSENTMLSAKWIQLPRGTLINLEGNNDVLISIGTEYDPWDPDQYGNGDIFYFDFDKEEEQYFNVHAQGGEFLTPGEMYGVYINGVYYDVYKGTGRVAGEVNYDTSTGILYLPSDVTTITSLMVVVEY